MEGEMEIEVRMLDRQTISNFAVAHDLVMEVNERASCLNSDNRFYAQFKHAEVADRGFLCGVYGDGRTVHLAIADYAEKISGKRLVINAYGPHRKEINVPILSHDK
jgi:hypothetical protein